MSVMVTIKTQMTSASIAEKAFRRRFQNVNVSGNSLTCGVKLSRRSYPINITFDLANMSVKADSDYRTELETMLDEAYKAEEIIDAAESEGRAWEETRNEQGDLVLEVEYA
jgi:hypothetical protein